LQLLGEFIGNEGNVRTTLVRANAVDERDVLGCTVLSRRSDTDLPIFVDAIVRDWSVEVLVLLDVVLEGLHGEFLPVQMNVQLLPVRVRHCSGNIVRPTAE